MCKHYVVKTQKKTWVANNLFASTSTPSTDYKKMFILGKKAGSALSMATNSKRYTVYNTNF
ncbi:hypothetical protein [Spiroplasma apis]|uniref:hypothetical protein n=1 Tax=Spiroplasma apis TaxID=2137 RepID=UPI001181D865|nr:hypothetical protein [Spiroplasma apis]